MLITYKNPTAQGVVRIEKKEASWLISYKDAEFLFEDSKVDFYPDMANVGFACGKIFLYWASANASDKCGFASSMFRNRSFNLENIGAFFVDKSGVSHFATRHETELAEGTEATIIDFDAGASRSEDMFVRSLPEECGAKEWNTRHRAKINNLGHIATNDVLAALEAQIDLQNRIILKLVAGEDAKEDAEKLISATANVTVDTLHNDDKLVQTINRQKAHIREVQKQYFAERGDATNADLSS